jgi:hypothetical protein
MPVILFYWFYRYCQGVEHVTQGHMSLATSFLLFIVLYLFSVGFVWPLVIQDAFNKVSDGPDNRPADPSYPEPPHPNQHPAPTPSPASTSAPADNPAATTTAASGSDGPVLYRR